jgi:hypothetical protein
MTEPPSEKALKALDAIVDKVLAYKPKPKSKPAKKRKKRAATIAKLAFSPQQKHKSQDQGGSENQY